MGEKEKRKDGCTMRRRETGDSRVVRNNSLECIVGDKPKVLGRSWFMLSPRVISSL